MDKQIQDILNDLYRIDPQFKAHEKELVDLVSKLMLAKPDTKFDEAFASKLRAELLQTKIRPMPSPYSTFFVSRAFYGIVGSAITILVVVPFTFIATQKTISPEKDVVLNPFSVPAQVKDETAVLTPKQQISNKGMNAFGKIALVPTGMGGLGGAAQDNVSAQSKSSQPMALSAPTTSPVSENAAVTTMPVRNLNPIAYTYKGETVSLKEKEGQVFMRTKGIDSGKQLAGMIQNSNFGLAKLNSFSDLKLSSIVLNENKEYGYSVAVNFDEGSINVNQQWERWSTLKNPGSLTASQMPSDATLIGIADAFVKEHGIDTTVYGKAVVQAMAPISIMSSKMAPSGEAYAPDVVSVIYPLIIEGKPVYESGGYAYGLYVAIDIRTKKVSGVNNLTSQTYDGSMYPLETDFNEIVKAATTSLANYGSTDESSTGSSTLSGTLGTPQHVLMHYWNYDQNTGASSELYIPALSFPITYSSKNPDYLPTAVVVPLVKDFLAKQTAKGVIPPDVPTTSIPSNKLQ